MKLEIQNKTASEPQQSKEFLDKKAIILKNVVKIYGDDSYKVEAVKGINLVISKGEVVTVMGPSGSGKSTLLNLLGAMDFATDGQVIVDGMDITHVEENKIASFRKKSIGFIFQDYYLLPSFEVLDNILCPLIPYGISGDDLARAKKILKQVGIEEKIHQRVTKLSGGQKQRVAIARALINNPNIILADEPTGNLDSETGKQIVDLLIELSDYGKTVIIVTHDPRVGKIVSEHPRGRNIWMLDGLLSDHPSVDSGCWGPF